MSDALNRRTFLNKSAISGAALGALASANTSFAAGAPSSKVVVGVMGMSRGRSLAERFAKQSGCEVKYVCDVDQDRAGKAVEVVEKAGGKAPQAIGDFRKILDDADVDALICAAPNHWHAPATILACAAGKHVYVEKPCSHNPREGELMVQAARKHNRAVQMGSQRRSSDGIIEGIQMVKDGAIGRAYCARSRYASPRGETGRTMPADIPAELDYELWQGPAPACPMQRTACHTNGTGSGTGVTVNWETTVCITWTCVVGAWVSITRSA